MGGNHNQSKIRRMRKRIIKKADHLKVQNKRSQGFPGGSVVKNPPAKYRNSTLDLGRFHMSWSN